MLHFTKYSNIESGSFDLRSYCVRTAIFGLLSAALLFVTEIWKLGAVTDEYVDCFQLLARFVKRRVY